MSRRVSCLRRDRDLHPFRITDLVVVSGTQSTSTALPVQTHVRFVEPYDENSRVTSNACVYPYRVFGAARMPR